MMADLMCDHIGLSEVTLGAQTLLQLLEELGIEIELLV